MIMAQVTLYATRVCPYCVMAERYLRRAGVESIHKILVDENPRERAVMMERTRRRTVPQIFIGTTHVGGYDDLVALDQAGGLAPLLNPTSESQG